MSVDTAPSTESDVQLVATLTAELMAEFPPATTSDLDFLGAQYDKGLAWVHFPVGFGGLGITPKHQGTINERIRAPAVRSRP